MFPFCFPKSSSYSYDRRNALALVSDNRLHYTLAVSRSSAVRSSVLCACQHGRRCLDGVQNTDGGPWKQRRKQEQLAAQVKERLLSSAYIFCSGNNKILVTASFLELTDCCLAARCAVYRAIQEPWCLGCYTTHR
jgi:hypothetical protein